MENETADHLTEFYFLIFKFSNLYYLQIIYHNVTVITYKVIYKTFTTIQGYTAGQIQGTN